MAGSARETSGALVLRLFGERWSIDLGAYADPDPLRERIRELWARTVDESAGPIDVVFAPDPDPGPEMTVTACTPRIPERTDGAFPYAFSRAVTQAAIERLAGSALLLHAAGLVSPDGERGVVLVASSGTGKSTAARTLGRRLGYLSDELMLIDAQERLQGLIKPLSIIVPEFPGGKDESSPDELGLGATPSAAPRLAALVCLSRAADEDQARLEPIGLHDLIAEVVPQTSSLWRVQHPLHRLAEAASRAGGPYRLRYAEIADTAPLVDGLLEATTETHETPETPETNGAGPRVAADPEAGTDARAAQEWIGHAPAPQQRWGDGDSQTGSGNDTDPPAGSDVVSAGDAPIVRSPWTDAIEQDGEVSVLVGPTFTRIAGIAATIWLRCAVSHTAAELVDALTEEHGPHPDASALVEAALGELAGRGLVRRGSIPETEAGQ
ncbi:MAG: hypothetical protein JST33_02615 [Actinobacteria bacterium]|nr:hypothetical protein [Actinomycetota bacterium]